MKARIGLRCNHCGWIGTDRTAIWSVPRRFVCPSCGEAPIPVAPPTIVCLCGSTRFYDAFQKANYEQTMLGKIVLSVGFYPHSSEQAHGEHIGITPEQKQMLDELHLRKIDMADEVLILNVGGYIGEGTRRELWYALSSGKTVVFLEDIEPAEIAELAKKEGKAIK